jgi:hypothetical protein
MLVPDEQQARIAQDHDVAISETLVTARAIFGISPALSRRAP